MMEAKKYRLWNSIFAGGTLLVGLVSFSLVIYLPFSYQWLNSLFCAGACFLGIRCYACRTEASQNGKRLSTGLLLMAMAEVVFSVLSLRVLSQKLSIPPWMFVFIILSPIVYMAAFRLLLIAVFPQAEKRMEMAAPDPLLEFPQPVQEIMKAGQKQVNHPVTFTILAFTLFGALAYLIDLFTAGDGNTLLFFIPSALAYLVGLPLGLILAYRWQRWARRSGISEEELRAAARAAHVWWPKTGEHARLRKPGNSPG